MSDHKKPLLSNEVYDVLVSIVQYVLPGAGTLYFALAAIWGLPYGEQVVGTLAAVAVFGGVLLGVSKKRYNASDAKYDGALIVDTRNPFTDNYALEVTTPINDVEGKREIVLKVDNVKGTPDLPDVDGTFR